MAAVAAAVASSPVNPRRLLRQLDTEQQQQQQQTQQETQQTQSPTHQLPRQPSDDGGIEACCAAAYKAPHVQASFSVWQKSPRSVGFVRLWRDLTLEMRRVEAGNLGDQTVLTALATVGGPHELHSLDP